MELTPEQKERIRQNKARALELRNKRKLEQQQQQQATNKRLKDDDSLEDFEQQASEWVTQKEAQTIYCLPEGTLAICQVQEKPNPRNPKWKPMKLYRRSELRQRAHKRHGGKEGLIQERQRRKEAKWERQVEEAKKVFE